MRGFTCVVRRYVIRSNSPSGGINEIVRSFSNRASRTHLVVRATSEHGQQRRISHRKTEATGIQISVGIYLVSNERESGESRKRKNYGSTEKTIQPEKSENSEKSGKRRGLKRGGGGKRHAGPC